MRAQNKLLIYTFALVLVLIFATWAMFSQYSETTAINRAREQVQSISAALSNQLETRIRQMDSDILFFLSEPDFLSAVYIYTMSGREENENRKLIIESSAIIRRAITNYAVSTSCFRAVMYTSYGDYFDSRPQRTPTYTQEETLQRMEGMPWLEKASGQWGKKVLVFPHESPWEEESVSVYSVLRAIPTTSGETCYIEIQNRMDELETILNAALSNGMGLEIVSQSGECFYRTESFSADSMMLLAETKVDNCDLYVRISQDRENVLSEMKPFQLQVLALCIVMVGLSGIYLYLASRHITKPIRAIRHIMESTALDTLENPSLPEGGDELKSLNAAFVNLCERLKTAMDAQMRAQEREANARMDALQAQVDPHFLYNTLNVIAGRAMAIGDDVIVDMCEDIAAMLRYSTDTTHRNATIAQETEHLRNYLGLMQRRYRQKLEYTVEIAPEIANQPMPKLVLQQFAENAIRHNLTRTGNALHFAMKGYSSDRFWKIEISDDGTGFAPEILTKLQEMIRENRMQDRLSIGGMGIANTYARLRRFYGTEFQMEFENTRTGAMIVLSAPMRKEEKKCA